jgi:nicotinamidase-related amidase
MGFAMLALLYRKIVHTVGWHEANRLIRSYLSSFISGSNLYRLLSIHPIGNQILALVNQSIVQYEKGAIMKQVLVLIDLQNDYFPGGVLPLAEIESAANNARLLLEHFRQTERPVIHIQHVSVQAGSFFFLPNTVGVQINQQVRPLDDEIIITKHFPNSFRETELLSTLSKFQPDEIIFCGAMSHMCVDATVRAAFDFSYNCTVAGDACTTLDLNFQGLTIPAKSVHGSFMAALQFVYANVKPIREIIGQ